MDRGFSEKVKSFRMISSNPLLPRKRLYEDCTDIFACKLLINMEIVVEAAGVEPASENVTGQETTCLFTFMPRALGVFTLPRTFATAAQNGQETVVASL